MKEKIKKKLIVNKKTIVSKAIILSMFVPQVTHAAYEKSFYVATPLLFTGSGLLFAALIAAILTILGGYVTIQVIIDWFKYIDAEPEERKIHMKGAKTKIMGGILALCTSGLVTWALAFYKPTA